MSWMLPLPVAVPLVGAAAIAAFDHFIPRRVENAIAVASAGAATAFSAVVLLHAQRDDVVHWFGGWRPVGGLAFGIGFVADPLGAGMATLACALALLALLYSWSYMREATPLYDMLMLVMCAGMAGFSLTGDLFNMFVWFELMAVAAYALAGFNVEQLGPLQGAVNFAITNTMGAYLILMGLGLLYARTGALNFAQLGHLLPRSGSDRLVIVALTLLFVGFFVKAAILPFHMWAADAHAVAPAPVAALFSAVELQLGLFAIARLYWAVFQPALEAHASDVKAVLVWLGVATAIVGSLMCFLQRHLKRMLAYSTIAHAGIVLVAIGLLNTKALAGAAGLVLAHGFLKAGLFLLCGIILLRLGEVDELRLHGAGRGQPLLAALWGLAAAGLIGIPYLGVFLGHSLVDDGAAAANIHWLQPLLMLTEAVSAGALLRAGARIFLGWGAKDDPLLTPEPREKPSGREAAAMPLLLGAATLAIVVGLAVSFVPGLQQRTEQGAERFRDHAGYVARVLHGTPLPASPHAPVSLEAATTSSWAYGLSALAAALAVAAFGLWRARLPALVRTAAARTLGPPVQVVRAAHSGIVGDYLLWLTIGTAVIGGVWAFTLR